MRLEHYPVEKLKKEILEIAKKYLDLTKYRLFFFGSRVTGRGHERSDIDIGIEGEQEVPPGVVAQIKEDLENTDVLYKIDVVDFADTSPEFKNIARSKLELIV